MIRLTAGETLVFVHTLPSSICAIPSWHPMRLHSCSAPFSYARTAGVNPSSIDQGTRSPSYDYLSSTQSVPTTTAISVLDSLYPFDPSSHALVYKPEGSHDSTHHGLAYKPVAKKVVAVPAPLAEGFRIVRRLPDDPLAGLKPLPTKPPDFIPGVRFTAERAEALDLDPANWLWPEELKLI
jgi:hypothetical protein